MHKINPFKSTIHNFVRVHFANLARTCDYVTRIVDTSHDVSYWNQVFVWIHALIAPKLATLYDYILTQQFFMFLTFFS